MNIPVVVHGVVSDLETEAQIVILEGENGGELLPIWVGATEGSAIQFAMEAVAVPRPMTHDLLRDILEHLTVQIEKTVIYEMNQSTYFAKVYLIRKTKGGPPPPESASGAWGPDLTVDARPSDAIALALRVGAPIYVAEELLRRDASEEFAAWLKRLKSKNEKQQSE